MKILIVGGVAGGATAAARLRRLNEQDEIIMFEKDEFISFANCGLPYYIGGVIKERDKLFVQTINAMSKRFNLDIRNFSEVTSIDPKGKKVKVKNHKTGKEYEESYDKLILSCGAKPIKPPFKGLDEAENVFVLRNIPDTDKIKSSVEGKKKAVVIGGGFIGVEMAENLAELGINVTIIEKMPQVLGLLDFDMAQLVHNELNANGVKLILGNGVSAFEDKGRKIVLDNGEVIETEMTILAIGVTPVNDLAKGADLKLGAKGHLSVDDNFNVIDKENDSVIEDVYAVGDMIEVFNPLDNTPYAIPLAWGANRQGRLVADHINGIKIKRSKIQATSVLKVFNLTVATTGANAVTLTHKQIKFLALHAHRANHASYYPDASNIAFKIFFDEKTGKIFGAQAVGREGTEKRIDVIATAMKFGAKIEDLADLELSYAPPYGSAKDPVNILGYIGGNVRDKVYKIVHADKIDEIVESGGYLLDVRTPIEFSAGNIKGAVNIELDALRDRIKEIKVSPGTPIYVTCQVGLRAYLAIKILAGNGFRNLYNLSGGYATYKAYNYKLNHPKREKKEVNEMQVEIKATQKELDVTGMQCPGPLMATYKAVNEMKIGDRIRIVATDCGFSKDVESWAESNGHTLVSNEIADGKYVATIIKGENYTDNSIATDSNKNATIVVFSGDLDKMIASMIIAQGAAAQGKEVTMFFTFWGLNALRKSAFVKTKKTLIEKMFGFMMPRGAGKLKLSKMNMLGMGAKMIKGIMRHKNVDDLPTMIQNAQAVGVKMIACTMSMDLMGIKKEELIDNIEYAGVATYIAANELSHTTLFI